MDARENYAGKSGQEMDEERQHQLVYQYMCHLEEAKKWMEKCLGEKLPDTTELEEALRNGVILAKLASVFAPQILKPSKIFDIDQRKYHSSGLHFRHTDNINYFLSALKFVGLPEIFTPETTDIYDMKNMPRVIFCIHALSLYLYQRGIIRHQIQDLYGKVTFTQEQISAMRQALEAVGLPMLPQFRRIGGMLADEIPVDAAALHAAIIAINEALDNQIPEATLAALQNPNACLTDIDESLYEKYHLVLQHGKNTKLEKNCENFATDGDAYDEMLTKDEIQQIIVKLNLIMAIERVIECVNKFDLQNLQFALMSRYINIKTKVKAAKLDRYCVKLAEAIKESDDNFIKPDDIEQILSQVNKEDDEKDAENYVIQQINSVVASGHGGSRLIELLNSSALGIGKEILTFAAPLYLSELNYIRQSMGRDLGKAAIVKTCKFLYRVAQINAAVRNQEVDAFWAFANEPRPTLADMEKQFCNRYFDTILETIQSRENSQCWLLNHAELQECIDQVNISNSSNLKCILAIEKVNAAVMNYDYKALHEAIHLPELNLRECLKADDFFVNNKLFLSEDDAAHFLTILRDIQQNRSQVENEESSLWMENIVDALRICHQHRKEATSASTALAIVNMAILQKDSQHTVETIRHRDLCIPQSCLQNQLAHEYQRELYHALKSKETLNGQTTPWVWHRLRSGDRVYLNLQKHSFSWNTPRNFHLATSQYLSTQDILDIIERVNQSVEKQKDFSKNIDSILTRLQARCRGFVVRQKLFTMLEHYYQNEDKIVKIQALWRGILQRRRFAKLLASTQRKTATKKVTSQIRSMEYYRRHTKTIVKIQRFWKAHYYKKQFDQLLLNTSAEIKLSSLRQFLHLLDLRSEDFEQELELQSLKGQISQLIRHNQSLEKDLDAMDIKIGLLIKNRIDLDEVMAHNKLLLSRKQSHKDLNGPFHHNGYHEGTLPGAGGTSTLPRGLKALKKESRQRLDAYQHLFYRLQTCPEYLAKLIFALPQSSSNKFIDSVIMTLYNFGANPREEYMLLKLFQTALEEEVENKVHQLNDIVSGSPLVIKMIVSYYRGKGSLKELLGPLVRSVIDDKNLHINLIPVEIYKHWINSLEFDSGKACGMPYDLSTEEALKYPEVVARFNRSVVQLKQFTTLFLATIVKAKAKTKLPYGLLYIAKVLYMALKKKFPSAPDKDVLKVVGNLIYYRYINCAIVAPDVFGIIDKSSLEDNGGLNPDQRRNLGNIAKILQFAAAKKGFGEESSYLTSLNPYIIECHEKFKRFFSECCCSNDIVEPSEAFSTDQYTEAALIAKPVIYISLQEICDTHKLLLDNIDIIAPDKKDKLHELLEDLGESASILSLLGEATTSETWKDGSLAQLGRTEVCLTLTNKFALETVVDRAKTDRLFVKTKQLLAAVLPCTKESNLIGCLKSQTTQEQSDIYWGVIDKRMAVDQKVEQNKTMLEHTNLFADDESSLPLDDCKRQILINLQILERHSYVSIKNGFQEILVSLAKDICNQKEYRARRRREIFKLRRTIKSLQTKSNFHEEQITYYNTYIKQCLVNLQVGDSKKKVRFQSSQGSSMRDNERKNPLIFSGEKSLRYTASKLHQKGILLSIDGLPLTQFKNVQFEFATTGDGAFEVHAKFMGVRLEHVEIDIQDLLQMQYEGANVINMFGKVKINVNLLLHFLNRKFYGRKR